jgi:hypothetical protein
VDRGNAIRVLLAFAGETIAQQVAHSLGAPWLQLADESELV